MLAEEGHAAAGHPVTLVRRVAATAGDRDLVPHQRVRRKHDPVAGAAYPQAEVHILVIHKEALIE